MKQLRSARKHEARLEGGRYCSVAAAVAAASIAGSVYTSSQQKKSANKAANAQTESSEAGIQEQQRQFDAVQALMAPFVNAGTGALAGQQDILGTNGMAAQQSAISGIQNSAQYQALSQSGQDAILANASATGGLRGGNVQAALGQFQPALLAQLIDQQYSRLGGLTSLGQNAAAGVGNAGMQTGTNIANLLGQQGSALAGSALANGRAAAGLGNGIGASVGLYAGLGGFGSGISDAQAEQIRASEMARINGQLAKGF